LFQNEDGEQSEVAVEKVSATFFFCILLRHQKERLREPRGSFCIVVYANVKTLTALRWVVCFCSLIKGLVFQFILECSLAKVEVWKREEPEHRGALEEGESEKKKNNKKNVNKKLFSSSRLLFFAFEFYVTFHYGNKQLQMKLDSQ